MPGPPPSTGGSIGGGGGMPAAAMGGMTPQGQQVGAYLFQVVIWGF